MKKISGAKGKKNGGYIDGRTMSKYYCSCGKEIVYRTALYGNNRCHDCAMKDIKVRNEISNSQKGRTAWNKGLINVQKPYWLGKSNKDIISKHHIDGNKNNNDESNFLKIKQGEHKSLHWNGYKYLAKINLVYDYLKDFLLKYEITDSNIKIDGKVLHHIDCNRDNNSKNNFMYLKDKRIHNKLHQDAYKYLVKVGKINDYIAWFFLMKKKDSQKAKVNEELK